MRFCIPSTLVSACDGAGLQAREFPRLKRRGSDERGRRMERILSTDRCWCGRQLVRFCVSVGGAEDGCVGMVEDEIIDGREGIGWR